MWFGLHEALTGLFKYMCFFLKVWNTQKKNIPSGAIFCKKIPTIVAKLQKLFCNEADFLML